MFIYFFYPALVNIMLSQVISNRKIDLSGEFKQIGQSDIQFSQD